MPDHPLLLALLACVLLAPAHAAEHNYTGYHCLDYQNPIGKVVQEVVLHERGLTVGEIARICNSHCSAEPSCTAAFSTAGVSTAGPGCQLLAHTAGDVARTLAPAPGRSYPIRQPSFVAVNGSKEKTLSYLCFRHEADFNELGALTHKAVRQGQTAGESYWCVFATDAAGINLDDIQSSGNLAHCAEQCDASSQCTFFVGRPGHCWTKFSPLVGFDGWTSAYRAGWLDQRVEPNAAVTCFKRLLDFQELGAQLSPNVATTHYAGRWFTLMPERVNFSEAAAACGRLPGGRLATLDTREALSAVGNALLPTLPMQYSLQLAWVGAKGLVDNTTAAIIAGDNPYGHHGGDGTGGDGNGAPAAEGEGPRWLSDGASVDASLYTHPGERYLQWRGSDASFGQYVPVVGKPVCVAVLGVSPPSAVTSLVPTVDNHTRPGLYVFTCKRPTAFICESASVPRSLQGMQRVTPQAARLLFMDMLGQINGSSGGGGAAARNQQLVLAVVLPVLGALLLLLWLSCLCCRHLRSLTRFLSMQRKRAMGLPRKGTLSVAVTDIQGFTLFMESHPEDMGKALMLHNQAIKQAAYANAGRVLVQEGDAFIVGFCEPLDAAAFALQVQLSLMQLPLPPTLTYDDGGGGRDALGGAECALSATSRYYSTISEVQEQRQQHEGASGIGSPPVSPWRSSSSSSASQGQAFSPVPHTAAQLDARVDSGSSSAPDCSSPTTNGGSGGGGGGAWASLQRLLAAAAGGHRPASPASSISAAAPSGQRKQPSVATTAGSLELAAGSSGGGAGSQPVLPLFQRGERGRAASRGGPGAVRSSGSALAGSRAHLSRRLSTAGSWWKQLLLQPQGGAAEQGLLRGLRVRIGIATAPVCRGQAVEMSAAYSMARLISDAAAGGQVLMDQATFAGVRQELQVLGAVTPSGLDFGRLTGNSRAAAWGCSWRLLCGSQASQPGGQRAGVQAAMVLDMGMYETPLCMLPAAGSSEPSFGLREVSLSVHPTRFAGRRSSSSSGRDVPDARPASKVLRAWQQQPSVRFEEPLVRQQDGAAGAGDQDQRNGHDQPHLQEASMNALHLESAFAAAAVSGLQPSGSVPQRRGLLLSSRSSRALQLQQPHSTLLPFASSISLSGPVCCSLVRLYQLLAPDLVGRAVLFGARLSVDETWRALDAPYFAAPGLCGCAEADPRQPHQAQWRNTAQQLVTAADAGGAAAQQLQQQQDPGLAPEAAGADSFYTYRHGGPAPPGSVGAALANSYGVRACRTGTSLAAIRAMSLNCAWPAASRLADLSALGGKPAAAQFPAVTAVFVAVEGVERLQHQQHQQHSAVRQLHALLYKLMLEALCVLPGYLVKAQEGEGKFLVTFSSAATAVAWCMVVQEAALRLPYPESLLRHSRLRPVCDASGRLVFRGPRLKMGVQEGVPTCIMPDHMGRADYLGPAINLAARLADAAAHGGQVAMELGLAQRIMAQWRQQPSARGAAAQAPAPAGPAGAAAPPGGASVAVEVLAEHLGLFLFKGCAKSVSIVSVCPASLAGRTYPADPPRGKGVRLSHKAGVLDATTVQLPGHVAGCALFSSRQE